MAQQQPTDNQVQPSVEATSPPDQHQRAVQALRDGWSPHYLTRNSELSFKQLHQLSQELQRPAMIRASFDWKLLDAEIKPTPESLAAAAGWTDVVAESLAFAIRRRGAAPRGQTEGRWQSLGRLSPRTVLNSPLPKFGDQDGWIINDSLWTEHLKRRVKGRHWDVTLAAANAVKDRAVRNAWSLVQRRARQAVESWGRRVVTQLVQPTGTPIPLVGCYAPTPHRVVGVVLDADGKTMELFSWEVAGQPPAGLAALPAAASRVVMVGEITRDLMAPWLEQAQRVWSWRTLRAGPSQWWAKSLTGQQGGANLDRDQRVAWFAARQSQDPLAALSELPTKRLLPEELAPLMDTMVESHLETLVNEFVHQQGLNIQRAGPRALARLCAISPLQAQRLTANRPESWSSLDEFRTALGADEQAWTQTEPFLKLEPSPNAAAPDGLWQTAITPLAELRTGEVRTGVCRRVTDFGAFLDIGATHDVLLHISEMADGFVADPCQTVMPDESLEVEIRKIQLDPPRISVKRATTKDEAVTDWFLGASPGGRDPSPKRSRQRAHKPAPGKSSPSNAKSAGKNSGKSLTKSTAKSAGPPPRPAAKNKPRSKPRRPQPPAQPISEDMADGKEPLRSFADLIQYYDRKKQGEPDKRTSDE